MPLTSVAAPPPRFSASTEPVEVLRKRVAASGKCTTATFVRGGRGAGPVRAADVTFDPDDDPWFPLHNTGMAAADLARRACSGCPVQASCLEVALHDEAKLGDIWGVRGGLAADERRDLIIARSRAVRS